VSILECLLGYGSLAQARPDTMLIGLILMMGVFYLIMFSGSRKEKKKRKEMLAAVKKGDRVMTIGGIIATVVTVKEDEIVLKVDESTNTKISFVRGAIQKVLMEDEKPTMGQ
jgi:preprotein translocase subunit YajC